MKYFLFLLTANESIDGNKKGFGYAIQNKNRWIEVPRGDELYTYDRGITHIVENNQVYHLYKDYLNYSENYRVFVCEIKDLQSDNPDISVI